jgi:hypothetical protein
MGGAKYSRGRGQDTVSRGGGTVAHAAAGAARGGQRWKGVWREGPTRGVVRARVRGQRSQWPTASLGGQCRGRGGQCAFGGREAGLAQWRRAEPSRAGSRSTEGIPARREGAGCRGLLGGAAGSSAQRAGAGRAAGSVTLGPRVAGAPRGRVLGCAPRAGWAGGGVPGRGGGHECGPLRWVRRWRQSAAGQRFSSAPGKSGRRAGGTGPA